MSEQLKFVEFRDGINIQYPYWRKRIENLGKYFLLGIFVTGFVVIILAYIQIIAALTDLLFNPVRWMK
jgi:hypothetical protein